jgi:hypothetical protein
MNDQKYTELTDLLQRMLPETGARVAEREIRDGERLLDAWQAPAPGADLLRDIQAEMVAVARRTRRRRQFVRAAVGACAALLVLGFGHLFGPGADSAPSVSYAGMIPHAVWDSDNVVAEDLDLAYYDAEIRRIEQEMRTLEAGEAEVGQRAVENLETEWMRIEGEFWKG